MPTLAPVPPVDLISAEHVAAENWRLNSEALQQTQSSVALALAEVQVDHEWVYARDGSVTGLEASGRWWAGCSVPLLAGRALLKTLEDGSVGSCFLDPQSAGLVRAARERMGPWAVLFVVQTDVRLLRTILGCHDFSAEILQWRLWFVCGDEWSGQLRALFGARPGLATPTRFIRTKLTAEAVVTPLITVSQTVFSDMQSARQVLITAIKSQPRKPENTDRILHIGGREFRLWDFGSSVLQTQLFGFAVERFDTDDALCTSPVALVDAVRNCGSVVAANLFRADSNQLVDECVPWITWITQPTIPLFELAGAMDGLVLADAEWRSIAQKAGWPEDRVRVAGWPTFEITAGSANYRASLGFICDTQIIQIPASVKDFSSHRLLWELIEEELMAEPLVVEDIDAYLNDRAQQLNIKRESLDRRAFIENLILPAYQQGLARLLMFAGLPISIYGKGWTALAEFREHWSGELVSEVAFNAAVSGCAGLIYCWPKREAHPIEALGKPIVHRGKRDEAQLIRSAKRVLGGSERRGPIIGSGNSLRGAIWELIGSGLQGGGGSPEPCGPTSR